MWPFKWKLLSSTFPWSCLLRCRDVSYFWLCGWNSKVWPFKWKLLSSTVYNAVQAGSNSGVRGQNSKEWQFKWRLLTSTSLYQEVLTFEFVVQILKCDHSNESYWAVLGSNFWVCWRNPTVLLIQGGTRELVHCNYSLHCSLISAGRELAFRHPIFEV